MAEHKILRGKASNPLAGERNSHLIKFLSTVSLTLLTLLLNEMLIRMKFLVQWEKNYLIST